jgi:hypothetical protein
VRKYKFKGENNPSIPILIYSHSDVFDVLNHLLKKDKQLEQQTKREKIGFKK